MENKGILIKSNKLLKSIKLAFVAAEADFSLYWSESLKTGLHMI